jgi:selenocysteine lyase/cysteine desulfurase
MRDPRRSTPDARPATLNRRQFARLVALGGVAPFVARPELLWAQRAPLPPTPASPNEAFWTSVRQQFLMPADLAVINAANLCPSSGPVFDKLYELTKDMDRDASPTNRAKLNEGREATRKVVAEFLRATPDEIILTRNTSESNNLVSNGIDLKAGDEVVIFQDNHPCNRTAWLEKAKRFGYTVKEVPQVNPHPGAEYYLDAFTKQFTARTKVVAFTHQTSSVGDLFPAKELCRLARERGILSLVDGAQTFGLMDVDLSDLQPDFYSGSGHKWPCGPKEVGILYVNKASHSKIWPTIYSAYPGAVGLSKTFESFGQRDEPALMALAEALKFQMQIGRKQIQARSQELAQALMAGLKKIDGVKIWTNPDPARSLAVVSFQPGNLDSRKLGPALYQNDKIACATRGGPGADRGGVRFSPHFYNLHSEIERSVAAIRKYVASGV